MLTHATRYIAVIVFFLHSLLCGNAYCCEMPCFVQDDAASVSHDPPIFSCPCHSEQQGHGTEKDGTEKDVAKNKDSSHDCDHHQHHFCQCLQPVTPNNATDYRVILNQNLFSLSIAFFPIAAPISTPELNLHTSATAGDLPAFGVRLHLLLEHFLI